MNKIVVVSWAKHIRLPLHKWQHKEGPRKWPKPRQSPIRSCHASRNKLVAFTFDAQIVPNLCSSLQGLADDLLLCMLGVPLSEIL